MTQSPEKKESQETSSTTVTEFDVELLQNTIKRLKDENSQLKMKLGPNYSSDAWLISYIEDIVSKSNPDVFNVYIENVSSTLSTYSINIDTFSHPSILTKWIPESTRIFYEMWEIMMKVGQRGVVLRPYRGSYDPSKPKNLKPSSSKKVLSHILHQTIEKPAARLVNAVGQKLGSHSNKTCVWYQDHVPEQIESKASKSFAESYPENAKMLDSTSYTQPDACFFGYGKLLMAGVHFDPQSLTVDSYKRFERFYQQYKRYSIRFTRVLKSIEDEIDDKSDDANMSQAATVFNIILITYSLMVKYNLEYSYATTGQCWLIFYASRNNQKRLYYDFFESKLNTKAPRKCQSTDYQYLKQTAFVKVASLLLKSIIEYREIDTDDILLAGNAEPNVSQESGDITPNAKQIQTTDEANGHSSSSHRPSKKQKTVHDQPTDDDAFPNNRRRPRPKYCTQKCLLGLKSNAPMHPECPNYAMHKKYSDSDLHPIQNTDLGMLFYRQLENKRGGFKKIYTKNNRFNNLYKITVYPYGYTFIGQGDQYDNRRYIRNEILRYNKLEKLQGEWIPVYLDYVRFSDNVRLDGLDDEGPKIYLMIFISYVGERPDQRDVIIGEEEDKKMKDRLLDLGIIKYGTYTGNMHWSKELNHEMLIDLDSLVFV